MRKSKSPVTAGPPLLHTMDSARATLGGKARSTMYGMVHAGWLRPVYIGRRIYFRHEDLLALVERLAAEQRPSAA